MKTDKDFRDAFGPVEERFQQAARRALAQGRAKRAPRPALSRAAVLAAALLLITTAAVAATAGRWGLRDFLPRDADQALIQQPLNATTQGEAPVRVAVREAATDGITRRVVVALTPTEPDTLVLDWWIGPQSPVSALGLEGEGTIDAWLREQGYDQVIYACLMNVPEGIAQDSVDGVMDALADYGQAQSASLADLPPAEQLAANPAYSFAQPGEMCNIMGRRLEEDGTLTLYLNDRMGRAGENSRISCFMTPMARGNEGLSAGESWRGWRAQRPTGTVVAAFDMARTDLTDRQETLLTFTGPGDLTGLPFAARLDRLTLTRTPLAAYYTAELICDSRLADYATKGLRVCVYGADWQGLMAVTPGAVRIRPTAGVWQAEDAGDGQVRVTYLLEADAETAPRCREVLVCLLTDYGADPVEYLSSDPLAIAADAP